MSIGSLLGSTSAHRPRRGYPASLRWLRPASYPPRRHLSRTTTPLLRRATWLHTSHVFLFYTTTILSVVQYPNMSSHVVLTPHLRVRQQYPAVYRTVGLVWAQSRARGWCLARRLPAASGTSRPWRSAPRRC